MKTLFLQPKKETKENENSTNSNSTYLVTFFLEKGADINHGTYNGETPLMYAIEGKNLEVVKLLLDCGADVEKVTKTGKTFRVLLLS